MHDPNRTPDADAAFWTAFHAAEREADAVILGLSGPELDAQDHVARAATDVETLLAGAERALRLALPAV